MQIADVEELKKILQEREEQENVMNVKNVTKISDSMLLNLQAPEESIGFDPPSTVSMCWVSLVCHMIIILCL